MRSAMSGGYSTVLQWVWMCGRTRSARSEAEAGAQEEVSYAREQAADVARRVGSLALQISIDQPGTERGIGQLRTISDMAL